MNAIQFRAIFHDRCKKNSVLFSLGHLGNSLQEVFCDISFLIPYIPLSIYTAVSILIGGSSFLMTTDYNKLQT